MIFFSYPLKQISLKVAHNSTTFSQKIIIIYNSNPLFNNMGENYINFQNILLFQELLKAIDGIKRQLFH